MRVNAFENRAIYSAARPQNVQKAQTVAANNQNINSAGPVISFSGLRNKNHIALAIAELPPFAKVGGVATVGKDYLSMGDWLTETLRQNGVQMTDDVRIGLFMPYYNGELQYNRKTGEPTGQVFVRQANGKPAYINDDILKKMSFDEAVKQGLHTELEVVDARTMQWGLNEADPVTLYKVVNPPIPQKNVDIYMVYTDATAVMRKPYDGAIAYSSEARPITRAFRGDSYAKFSKGLVEGIEALDEKGFRPETVICSDSQTSFVAEYAARKNMAGVKAFDGLKISDVYHNMGAGYCGETSAKNMFSNFATKEQIEAVCKDPKYFEALRNGTEEEYFKQFIGSTLDAKGAPNPNMIPLHYLKQGYVSSVDTVSEGYAEAVARNANVSPGLHPAWKELYEQGKVGGILNGFEDPNVTAFKAVNLEGYSTRQEVTDLKGVKRIFEPLEIFPEKSKITFEDMMSVKTKNKINVLSRMSGDIADNTVMTGNPNRSFKLIGSIDPKYVDMLQQGKKVTMFSEWGRGDVQKGHTIALKAIRKFAKTPEGQDSVFVLGAGLVDGQQETARIRQLLNEINADEALRGRVAFFDGFAPSYALASASDATLVPSKFAPCELVDLEAAKYFSTPIVTNTQGLAQKNFDPRNATEAVKANAYKTQHEFDMVDDLLDKIIRAYPGGNEAMQAEVKQEFSAVEEGAFTRFAKKYNALLDKFRKTFRDTVDTDALDDVSLKAMKETEDYREIVIALKEDILTDEMVEAMKARVADSDNETARTIFKNQLDMDTSWTKNGMLHPSGKSSWELYKERHIDPEPQPATKSVFSFDGRVKETVSSAGDSFTTGATAGASSAKGTVKDAAEAASGAAAAAAQDVKAAASAATQDAKNVAGAAADAAQELGSQVSGFKKYLTDKRAILAFTGILAAGALIGFGISKARGKKKAQVKQAAQGAQMPLNQAPVAPAPVLQAVPTAPVTPATPVQMVQNPLNAQAMPPNVPSMNKFVAHFTATV